MLRAQAQALVVVLLVAARAGAEPRIRVSDCPPALSESLPARVMLEIDVLLRERGSTSAPPDDVSIRCADDSVHLEVTMPGASRESTLDVHGLAAEHRARAVALAAAELVHSLASREAGPGEKPAPTAEPPRPPAKAAAPARAVPPRRPSPRPALRAGALAEWLGKPAMLLFGARAAFEYPLGLVVPALSLDGALGSLSAASARVTSETLAGAAHLYLGTATGRLRWEAGPGLRFGWARLTGLPDAGSMLQGQALSAAWGGPEARARVVYGAGEKLSPSVAFEIGAGIVTLPVRGLVDGNQSVYAIEGAWLSVCAELGLEL